MAAWHGWARAVCGAALLLIGAAAPLSARPPVLLPQGQPWPGIGPPAALVAPCDQYDPLSPARGARITLDSRDLVHWQGHELRSFVDTGSIGRADVAIVGATPPGIVLGVSAIPEISRISPYFGERLKGIALDVALQASGRPVRVVLAVRQVCARYFRNTFLYY